MKILCKHDSSREILDQTELPQLLKDVIARYQHVSDIIMAIKQAGGRAYLVGGAVRDMLLRLPIHDLDIEVHGLSLEQVSSLLQRFAPVSLVGKSFGVLKLAHSNVDWSLPRWDASGRKPEVVVDPSMGITQALRRRDLTMNALAIDLDTKQLIDPFGGVDDLKKGVLRSPDITFFKEDPLRFYRVMQFIGRFEMLPDKELADLCSTMDISTVSLERFEDEFEKLWLKSRCPSWGIRWLSSLKRLQEILPELADTIDVAQDPLWHPEGAVFEHLMQTLDAAAAMDHESSQERLISCYAALCHDLGKAVTSIVKDGRIKSPGHAEAGVPLTRSLLRRITRKSVIIDTCCLLVRYHMQPVQFVQLNASLAAYRRLALKLAKYTTLAQLSALSLADQRGRNPQGHVPLTSTPHFITVFLKRAAASGTLKAAEKPLLHGRDIEDLVSAGPEMGDLLRYAFRLQIEKGIKDKTVLRNKVVQHITQKKRHE